MTRALVLYSGGLKSAFLAIEASKEREGSAILLYLLPGPAQEEAYAEQFANMYGYRLVKKDASLPSQQTDPLLHFLLLFYHAVPVAREYRCNVIYHGLSREDFYPAMKAGYVEEFIASLQVLLNMSLSQYDVTGTYLGDIQVETPLRRLRMEHVIRLGNEWRISWERTWSCMCNGKLHCGKCPKCVARKKAFETEGTEDLTIYKV